MENWLMTLRICKSSRQRQSNKFMFYVNFLFATVTKLNIAKATYAS